MQIARRCLCYYLSCMLLALGAPRITAAEVIETQALLKQGESDARAQLYALLERQEIASELARFGVEASEVKLRVASLTDEQARDIAASLPELPAGGDGVGAVVGAIVIIFLVLLVMDILGLTKVFPFTRPVRR